MMNVDDSPAAANIVVGMAGKAWSAGTVLNGLTVLLAVVEWLLFELVRLPYRPPEDPRTLLGTEKYLVLCLMGLLAGVWMTMVGVSAWSRLLSARDWLVLLVILQTLVLAFGSLAIFPSWPVTPLDLLLV